MHAFNRTTRARSVFSLKLLVLAVLACLSIYFSTQATVAIRVTGILLLGVMLAHAIELQHQCLHGSAFVSRRTNRLAGILLGLPSLVSYTHYQFLHLAHHRNLGTKNDAEFFDNPYLRIRDEKRTLKLLLLLWSLFNFPRLIRVLRDSLKALFSKNIVENAPREVNKKIRMEYLTISAALFAVVILSFYFDQWGPILTWACALFLVSEPVHSLIELPEHAGCERNTTDPFKNTRTINGSWFSFWLTNGNNYHVEHHKYPSLPINELPDVYLKSSGNHKYHSENYFEFFAMFFEFQGAVTKPTQKANRLVQTEVI
jgi:fatty acid desaturase